MRKLSTILIVTGVILFLINYLNALLFMILPPGSGHTALGGLLQTALSMLTIFAQIMVLVGILLRVFSPTNSTENPNNISTNPNDNLLSETDKDIRFFIFANLFGIVLWPAVLFTSFLASAGSSSYNAGIYTSAIALPVAAISLIIYFFLRKKGDSRALLILKVPFYYGIISFVVIFVAGFFGMK